MAHISFFGHYIQRGWEKISHFGWGAKRNFFVFFSKSEIGCKKGYFCDESFWFAAPPACILHALFAPQLKCKIFSQPVGDEIAVVAVYNCSEADHRLVTSLR